jgi:succinate dehydrogenase hydrophobic anchor subunit
MVVKSLGQLEEHAYFVLFMAFILVLFWHGVWGLADNLEHYLKDQYGMRKEYFNAATIMLVVLIIGLFPKILEKL